MGIINFSPIAQGILSGKYYKNNIPEDSRAAKIKKRLTGGYDGTMQVYLEHQKLADGFYELAQKK